MAAVPKGVVGFRAELRGASLWDLVQMECLARSRAVIRVSGEGGIGYLYFAEGRVVHAATARLIGEEAAMEILGWTNGVFQPCERAWPAAATIDTPCEGLILQLAQRRDDAGASNLVAFPGASPSLANTGEFEPPVFEEIEMEELEENEMADVRASNIDSTSPAAMLARGDLTADFPVVLRLGANGTIVKNKGGSDDLAGVVAYAQRLGQLAGELLGIEPFVAMECTFAEGRFLIFAEENGDIVALKPRAEANLQPLRERLGL
jgi:hypothetical protein